MIGAGLRRYVYVICVGINFPYIRLCIEIDTAMERARRRHLLFARPDTMLVKWRLDHMVAFAAMADMTQWRSESVPGRQA